MAIQENLYDNMFEDRPTGGLSAMQRREGLANIVSPLPQKQTANTSDKNATIDALIKQIQARSNTSKWTGGYGADAATKDMARILAETGITDISQFGPITREVQEYVGTEYEGGPPVYQTRTEQTFGNKLTGQAVPNTYSERQTGNFFGGTFEGKGNTGYGVQFDSQGNPIFYTQGASSSDIGNIAPLLTIASFVPGLQPFAAGLNALISAKQGNVLGAIAGAAGLGNMAGISGMADIANAAKFANALKSGDPLAIAMAGANAGGVSDIGGFDLKDISKTIGAVKAIESGDPLALLRYGMSAFPQSGESSVTKSSADLQKEDPLSPEEQAELIENRLNTAISRSQISPEEEEANTQNAIAELERLYGPSPATRSLTGGTQVDEADDFLKSIGINTIDRPSDSGLSNDDILKLVNADTDNLLITGNRDKTSAPSPIDDYFKPTPKKLENLEIVGNLDKTKEHVFDPTFGGTMPLPVADPNRIEIVGNKEPKYLPTDDDFPSTPITDAGNLTIVGDKEPKYLPTDDDFPSTPMPTTPGATSTPKAPTIPKAPTAPRSAAPAASSGMDLNGLLGLLSGQQQPAQPAPMQDPYAHIKLMEELFGPTINLTPAGGNTTQRK
jgi:hypothetical protein